MTSDFVTVVDGILEYNDKVWENIKKDDYMQVIFISSVKQMGKTKGPWLWFILNIKLTKCHFIELSTIYVGIGTWTVSGQKR